ncbi:MAG TPA: hypothetical protein VMH02_06660, partial [Verrucomicrobiae bacterium]|nr:hypothetical protein [Verrucomicrobiae bacterium]
QASDDGHVALAYLQPGTGFAYFDVGEDPATDRSAFQIVRGPDGRLYYGTLGPPTCAGGICSSPAGAIGRFDPATGRARQIALRSEVLGLLFTGDGALWFAGGTSHRLYRMRPREFSASALTAIPVPAPVPNATYTPRLLAQDGAGNVWFGDGAGGRVLRIASAGPYRSSSVAAFAQPRGPRGTPGASPFVNGIAVAGDGDVYVLDSANGTLDQVDPRNGRTTAQLVLPQQRALGAKGSVEPRFLAKDASGALLASFFGASIGNGLSRGGIDRYVPGAKGIAELALASAPAGALPDTLSIEGADLYYTDAGARAVGFVDVQTRDYRLIPTQPFLSLSTLRSPNGVVAMPDGTAWFTCAGDVKPFAPLCLGHTVYLDDWSLFPGPSFDVGIGGATSQVVGMMENPAQDSGPFTVRSDRPGICRAGDLREHDFVVTGVARGRCTIVVTDAHHVSKSLQVVVTAQ